MKKLLFCLSVVCITLIAGACKNPLSLPAAGSKGTLTIVISESVSTRTLAPVLSMTPASYTISGVHTADGQTFSADVTASEPVATKSGLAFGAWAITVNAYNDDSPTPTKIGTGEKTVTVQTNKTVQANITVSPLAGKGTINLTTDWSGTIENASATAKLTPVGSETSINISINKNDDTYENSDVEAGYYTLQIQLFDTGTLVAGAAESVRIVAGQTTSGTISFLDVQGPGGSIAANVSIDMNNPITVSIARTAATTETTSMIGLSATQTGAAGTADYTWYVNGGSVPDGSIIDGATLRLPAANLAAGSYRIDALATAGSQAGSGFFTIRWQGSLRAAPSSPQANWAYFNTTSEVPYFWDGTEWQTFCSNLVTAGGTDSSFSTIQDAIDAPYTAGYIIKIAAGTYDGTVDITKQVSLVGAGSNAEGTVLVNTAAQGDFTKLPGVPGITYGTYRPTLIISASGTAAKPLLIKDIRIGPRANIGYPRPAILLRPGSGADRIASYSYIALDNVDAVGHAYDYSPGQWGPPKINPISANEWGVAVDGCTSVDHLTVTNCTFGDMVYGIIFFNSYPNPSTATNIDISNSVFERNIVKGFYAEKLANSAFTNVTFKDNGDVDHTPYYWAGYNAGIDVNLKYGNYANLSFENLTVTGNGLDSYAGAGLTIKARGTGDDTTYSEHPATLSGVTITGGTYTGNQVGIRFGEIVGPSASNDYTNPAEFSSLHLTSPALVAIQGASVSGNVKAQILNAVNGLSIQGVDQQLVTTSY